MAEHGWEEPGVHLPRPAQVGVQGRDMGVETLAPEQGFGGDGTGQGPDLSTTPPGFQPAVLLAGHETLLLPAHFLVCKIGVLTLLPTSGYDEDEGGYRTVPGTWQPEGSWSRSEKQDQHDSWVPFLEHRLYGRCYAFSKGSSLGAQWYRTRLPVQETQVSSLGWEDPLKKETAARSGVLAWKIP